MAAQGGGKMLTDLDSIPNFIQWSWAPDITLSSFNFLINKMGMITSTC